MTTESAPHEVVARPPGLSRPSIGARAWSATHRFRPVLAILIILFTYFSLTQDGFFDTTNLSNLLTGVSILWVISIGMTFVLISGGFDLSVGAIMALAGIFLAALLSAGVPSVIAVVLTIVFGGVVGGVINGLLIGRLGLSFFVVTLASMIAITGVVSLWSNTETVFVDDALVGNIGMGSILGIATPIWIMAITLIAGLWIQHRTYLGRDIFAAGGSRVAAGLAGIRTSRTLVIVYALSGLAAGIAGVIAVGRIGAASPQVDNVVALDAAAAVLLGGTSLMGGAGGLGGTVFGVLFIGVLQNGLSIAGVQSFWQQVVTGVILVVAVLGDRIADHGGLRRIPFIARRKA
ncbi:MAG: ABC transporter permease [Miltoncostaeaceae bacterium]